MGYQMAHSTGGGILHIARDGATLCTPKYAPDNFEAAGTLAQTKHMVNTLGAMRPCEDCIDRAHEILEVQDAEGNDGDDTDQDDTPAMRVRFLHIGQAVKAGHIDSPDQWRHGPFVTGEVISQVPNDEPARHLYTVRVDGTGDIVTVPHLDAAEVGDDYREPTPQPTSPGTRKLRTPNRVPAGAEDLLNAAEGFHAAVESLETMTSDTRDARDDAIRAAIAAGATMYSIAKRLGISEQAVRRIRDRG